MLTFIQTIKDTKTQLCSQGNWEEMVNSQQAAEYIKLFRKTKNIDWKQRLPAVNFHGYDPKVLKGLQGSRKQADMIPTGLFMLDIDHVQNPKQYWDKLKEYFPKEELDNRLALVHITPSGEGLRIVMKGSMDSDIISDQQNLANLLGVKHDACTKDLSRWSFIPTTKDILYINHEILFSPTPTLPPGGGGVKNDSADVNPYAKAYANKSDSADVNPYAKAYANKSDSAAYAKSQTADENSQSNSIDNLSPTGGGVGGGLVFPSTYRGITYEKIVDALIQYHGGTPEVGERHHTIITLSNDLRAITDSNVDWLMQIIPNFDKPDFEKRDAITWAVQHNSLRKTKALAAVLDWLQNGKAFTPEQAREEEIYSLDEESEEEARKQQALKSIPQMPEKLPKLVELLTSKVMDFQKPALAQMIFPPLAAHVPEACFKLKENKPFELSLMGVVVGQQSVGKGCIDDPVEEIMRDIKEDDEIAEAEMAAYDQYEKTKGANDKGRERPTKPIRILETNTTYPALLQSFKDSEKGGYAKNLCCFTKCEEIEELYDMGVTNGSRKITQLIKKTYDRGRIGSGRVMSTATKGHAALRWNWLSATTPDKAKSFFKRVITDGTVSRVDFSVIIAPDEDLDFVYGSYDDDFSDALEPYIKNLRDYRGQWDKHKKLIPLFIPQVAAIDEEMGKYIKDYAKTMPDDTWKNFAWRTKMNAIKKIIVLYIANGGKWEEEFEPFCWWSFYYSMWVKMNLFYEKASVAFGEENIVSEVGIRSPLEILPDEFTREEFTNACKKLNCKTEITTYISMLKYRKKIKAVEKNIKFVKIHKTN